MIDRIDRYVHEYTTKSRRRKKWVCSQYAPEGRRDRKPKYRANSRVLAMARLGQAEVHLCCVLHCVLFSGVPHHETWSRLVVWTQQGIKELLFGIKDFDCGVQTGSGDLVISTHDHLQFASKNRAWVVDLTTSVVRGMYLYLSVVFYWTIMMSSALQVCVVAGVRFNSVGARVGFAPFIVIAFSLPKQADLVLYLDIRFHGGSLYHSTR